MKTAYLTFDDGPSKYTAGILDILRNANAKATFFVLGVDTPLGRQMYTRIKNEGHEIGNHSYSHNYSRIYRSAWAFKQDFFRLEKLLQSVTGNTSKLIRFPGGSNNTVSHRYGGTGLMPKLVKEMASLGYTHFDWNVESQDSGAFMKNSPGIVSSTLKGAANKTSALILLHDGVVNAATVAALPGIISGLRAQRFSFSLLSAKSFRVQFIRV